MSCHFRPYNPSSFKTFPNIKAYPLIGTEYTFLKWFLHRVVLSSFDPYHFSLVVCFSIDIPALPTVRPAPLYKRGKNLSSAITFNQSLQVNTTNSTTTLQAIFEDACYSTEKSKSEAWRQGKPLFSTWQEVGSQRWTQATRDGQKISTLSPAAWATVSTAGFPEEKAPEPRDDKKSWFQHSTSQEAPGQSISSKESSDSQSAPCGKDQSLQEAQLWLKVGHHQREGWRLEMESTWNCLDPWTPTLLKHNTGPSQDHHTLQKEMAWQTM